MWCDKPRLLRYFATRRASRCQIGTLSGTPLPTTDDFDLERYVNEAGFPLIEADNHTEVQLMPGDELIDALEQSYREWGTGETIVVTRTNKRANIFNKWHSIAHSRAR